MDIELKVKQSIASALSIDVNSIKSEHYLVRDLGADSLNLIMVQKALEDNFGLDLNHLESRDFNCKVSELTIMIKYFMEKSKE